MTVGRTRSGSAVGVVRGADGVARAMAAVAAKGGTTVPGGGGNIGKRPWVSVGMAVDIRTLLGCAVVVFAAAGFNSRVVFQPVDMIYPVADVGVAINRLPVAFGATEGIACSQWVPLGDDQVKLVLFGAAPLPLLWQ